MKRAILALLLTSCSPHAENALKAAQYERELRACLDQSKTREAFDQCHCDVNKRWQRPCGKASHASTD